MQLHVPYEGCNKDDVACNNNTNKYFILIKTTGTGGSVGGQNCLRGYS